MNKHGFNNFLVTILIIVVSGIVLLTFGGQLIEKQDLEGQINLCHISAVAQTNTGGAVLKSPVSLECNTRFVKFYDNKVEIGISPDKTPAADVFVNGDNTKSFSKLNDYIVNQVVAEEMRICWFQFGEGKVDVFNEAAWWGPDRSDTCFVCSQISFKNGPGKKYYDFLTYIQGTTLKNSKMTYYQYFNQPGLSPISWENYIKDNKDRFDIDLTFDSSETYAVIFTKQDKILKGNRYYVFTIPSSKLNDACTFVAS